MTTNFITNFTSYKDSADDTFPALSPGQISTHICKEKFNKTDRVICQRSFVDTDATELANDFTLSATLAIANNTITLTTAGSSTDDAGIKTDAASFYRADAPYFETKAKLTSIADVAFYAGFLKDADELAYMSFDIASSANWRVAVNGGGTTQYTDTGIPVVAATYYKLGILVDTAGKVYGFVNDVITPHTGTNVLSSAAHYMDVRITESAAAAKVATVKYLEWSFNK